MFVLNRIVCTLVFASTLVYSAPTPQLMVDSQYLTTESFPSSQSTAVAPLPNPGSAEPNQKPFQIPAAQPQTAPAQSQPSGTEPAESEPAAPKAEPAQAPAKQPADNQPAWVVKPTKPQPKPQQPQQAPTTSEAEEPADESGNKPAAPAIDPKVKEEEGANKYLAGLNPEQIRDIIQWFKEDKQKQGASQETEKH